MTRSIAHLGNEPEPVLRAATGARSGAPLTDEERRAKEDGAVRPWIDCDEMSAEIARRKA